MKTVPFYTLPWEGFDRKLVFGNKKNSYPIDLMKGIIANIRNREENTSKEAVEKSSSA